MRKCYCPAAKLHFGEPALCEYCAYAKGKREELERCAKLVESMRRNPMNNGILVTLSRKIRGTK